MSATGFDHEVDVLVVGSGGGGMTAALKADADGLDALIVEKSAQFGGSTALSGGQSGAQPLAEPKPYQPQNQPSWEAPLSRILTAAPLTGKSLSGSTSRHVEIGPGNIYWTMIAPSGIGGSAGPYRACEIVIW